MKISSDKISIHVQWNRRNVIPYRGRRLNIFARVMSMVAIFCCTISIISSLEGGFILVAALLMILVTANVLSYGMQTAVAQRRRAQYIREHRPRPDYRFMSVTEREIWGRPFHHDGAPCRCDECVRILDHG
jgi:hypothetical protein